MFFDRMKRQGSVVRRAATAVVESMEGRQHFDGSFGTAVALGPVSGLVVKTGFVNTTDNKNDYFKFSLAQAGRLRVTLDGAAGDADLYLYNAANLGNQIGSSTNGNVTEAIDKSNVPAGTYYARVNGQGSGKTNYTFAVQTDFAGNTKAAARVVGAVGSTEKVFKDFIGNTDKEDWYKFNTTADGVVTAKLEGLTQDVDLELYNAGGTKVLESRLGGTQNEAIYYGSAGATYYARVYQYTKTSNYTLKLKNGAVPADAAGSYLQTAKNFGTVGGTVTASDWVVHKFDYIDVYKFFVAEKGNIEVKLTGLKANLNVELLDVNGNVTASSSASGNSNESITKLSNFGGTYYVRVSQGVANAGSPYNLSITAPKDGGPNTKALAKQLTLSSGEAVTGGFVGVNDREDWYKVTVAAGKNIQATLTNLTADADIQLIKSDGTILDASTKPGTASEAVDLAAAPAGTYFFRVYNYQNNQSGYKLNISVV